MRLRRPYVLIGLIAFALSVSNSPPVVGSTVDDARLEAVRFRQEFGFPVDTPHLDAVDESSSAVLDYGVPLTIDEAAEMDRRVAIEAQLGELGSYLESKADFGGWYIDQAAGHIIEIGFTGDPEAFRQDIQGLIPRGAAFHLRKVANTERDLRQLQDDVFNNRDWLARLWTRPYEVMVNAKLNMVEIGLSVTSSEILASLDERYGSDRIRVYRTLPGELTHCTSRDHCHGPLRGGVQLFDSGCSNAFFVKKNNVYYTLTAGHCYIPGHTYEHPNGTDLGTMVSEIYYDGTSADAGIVQIPSSQRSRRVYITSATYYPILYAQQRGAPGEVQGMTVCLSGRLRGEGASCGTIYSIDFPFEACIGTYPNCSGYTTLLHQRSGTYTVAVGDSGGAIFSGNTAFGVQSSKNTATPPRGIYSHISYALSGLGATLCTTCP